MAARRPGIDDRDHGTDVAGTIVAIDTDIDVEGVAPQVISGNGGRTGRQLRGLDEQRVRTRYDRSVWRKHPFYEARRLDDDEERYVDKRRGLFFRD